MSKIIDNTDKIGKLANAVMHHKRAYYSGKPEISDAEYDVLEDQLRKLSPDHPALKLVGALPPATSKKQEHDVPMLSLQKTYTLKELHSWRDEKPVVGMYKIDGNSLSLVYENGRLALSKTRGNGRIGEDVSEKAAWVSDIPSAIDTRSRVEVRGELYCSRHQFIELSDLMDQMGLDRPTSPRNIVAGLLGRKTHYDLVRYFNFFGFEVIDYDNEIAFKTEEQKFAWLAKQGFRLPMPERLESKRAVETYLEAVYQFMIDGDLSIDGAVFSYDDLSLQLELGHTSHHPRYKMSFKWQGQTATATIREITWSTSRLGNVTPVAVIEPVDLSGAKITNITLHNVAHVQAYNLKSGDKIEIVRSGEVIPKFLQVISSAEGKSQIPGVCPSCGTPLEHDDVRLRCPNSETCPAQQMRSILNWIRCADIDDLSEKRLMQMMEAGLVSDVSDLYRLTIEDFLTLPATKEKMATKLHTNIARSRELPLAQFLNGLGIEGAGRTTWEKLLEVYPALPALMKASANDLAQIDGFAERSAVQIVEGLKQKSSLMEQLFEVGVRPTEPRQSPPDSAIAGGPLSGQTFVITGTLSVPREELEEWIKRLGGKTTSSVSKSTTAVVAADATGSSSKLKKARQLSVPIWSEAELRARGG